MCETSANCRSSQNHCIYMFSIAKITACHCLDAKITRYPHPIFPTTGIGANPSPLYVRLKPNVLCKSANGPRAIGGLKANDPCKSANRPVTVAPSSQRETPLHNILSGGSFRGPGIPRRDLPQAPPVARRWARNLSPVGSWRIMLLQG
jgi:hypothetical protein